MKKIVGSISKAGTFKNSSRVVKLKKNGYFFKNPFICSCNKKSSLNEISEPGARVQKEQVENLLAEIDSYKKTIIDQNDIIEGLKHTREKIIQCEKLAALGRFTADVAHEIRNPLTAVGGFARRLLKRLKDADRDKEYAKIIVSEVDRLEKILRDVLTFSKDTKPNFKKYNVSEIIEESLSFFGEILAEQNIDITRDFYDVPDVMLDRNQIRQVFDNLISNAVDAMLDSGKLFIKISVEQIYGVKCVTISVSDSGVGIPQQKLDVIFEPFVTSKEIGHGTGLGLPISRKIMEEHNGFIRCESKVDEGSTFKLFFPYQTDSDLKEIQCWEYMKCGKDCSHDNNCPAYPHFGRICWAIAGTFCDGRVQGSYAQKIENCKRCNFYKSVSA